MSDGLKFVLELDQKMSGLEKAINSVGEATSKIEKMTEVVERLEASQKKIKAPAALLETKKKVDETTDAFTKMDREIAAARDELKKLRAPDELLKIKKQLHDIKSPVREIGGMQRLFSDVGKGMFGGIAGMASGVFIGQAITGAFSAAIDMIGRAVSGIIDIGKEAITAAGHQERLGLSFKQLLGEEPAKALLADLDKLQTKTALTGTQLSELARGFLNAGATAEEIRPLLAGALDMGSLLGGSEQAIQRASQALSEMFIKGKAEEGVFTALNITEKQAFADLEKRTGLGMARLKELMAKGKLDGRDLVGSVLSAIEGKGGGKIGTFAAEAGKTLDARMTHLKDIPGRLFEGAADGPGFAKLSDFIDKLQKFLDPSSSMGSKMQEALNRTFDALATKLQNIDLDKFADKMVTFLDQLPGKIEALVEKLQKLLDLAGKLAFDDGLLSKGSLAPAAVNMVLDPADQIGYEFEKIFSPSQWSGPVARAVRGMFDAGEDATAGMAKGIQSGEFKVTGAADKVAKAAPETVVDGWQIHSPSRVFAKLGQHATDGLALGLDSGRSSVESAMSPMIDIPAPSASARPASGLALGGAVINVNVTVDGSGSPQETAEEVARVLPMHLAAAFDRWRGELAT